MAAGRLPVLFEDVAIAATRIRGGVTRTALTHSHWLSQLCGCEVFLKHEQTMFTGSFKERGARNALLSLSEEERARGVVAASAGNHALALSWHGKQLGVPVSVLMPTVAPMAKRSKCATFGAHIVVHGDTIGDAKLQRRRRSATRVRQRLRRRAHHRGRGHAGPRAHRAAARGDHFDYVMVPCGGAGSRRRVAAIKALRAARVVGVEPRNCASFSHALAVGHPDPVETTSTLADGLAVPTVGANAFEVARAHADDVCIVDEADVALAVLRLLENEKVTIEGGGATGLAAILPGGPYHDQVRGAKVAVPLCGGNIDVTTLGRVIDRGMAADGRLVRFVAEIKFILECTGADHSRAVREAMIDAGVTILVWGREVYAATPTRPSSPRRRRAGPRSPRPSSETGRCAKPSAKPTDKPTTTTTTPAPSAKPSAKRTDKPTTTTTTPAPPPAKASAKTRADCLAGSEGSCAKCCEGIAGKCQELTVSGSWAKRNEIPLTGNDDCVLLKGSYNKIFATSPRLKRPRLFFASARRGEEAATTIVVVEGDYDYLNVSVSRVHPGSPSVAASSARAQPDARVDASRTRGGDDKDKLTVVEGKYNLFKGDAGDDTLNVVEGDGNILKGGAGTDTFDLPDETTKESKTDGKGNSVNQGSTPLIVGLCVGAAVLVLVLAVVVRKLRGRASEGTSAPKLDAEVQLEAARRAAP
ncbi:L-threonine ammonia-lyase [Aureococcus anophagefferens]|nr:L-threonine ammonia-lyase [Aureococcus anophagefferens]